MSINTLLEAEQRIRQANSADEMLEVLALCSEYDVNLNRTVDDIIKEYDKYSQRIAEIMSIAKDPNASQVSRLEAEMATMDIPDDIKWNYLTMPLHGRSIGDSQKAREELIRIGRSIRKTIEKDIKDYQEYSNNIKKFYDYCDSKVPPFNGNKRHKDILESKVSYIYCNTGYIKDFEEYLKFIEDEKKATKDYIRAYCDYDGVQFEEEEIDKYFDIAFSDEKMKEIANACPKIKTLPEILDKLKDKLLKASPVTEKQAQEWVETKCFFYPSLTKALNKNNYQLEDFKKDCAEFYRLVGGKVGIINFTSDDNSNRSCCYSDNEIFMNGVFTKKTLFHEMSHAVENDSNFSGQCSKDFILSRATSRTTKKLKDIVPNSNYEDWEVAYEDHFIDPYVGKWYKRDSSEVLSMGIQQLATPALFYEIITKDPEHLDYILGVCTAKEHFSKKRLEYNDEEKRIIELRKKGIEKEFFEQLEKHFNEEKQRIRYAEIEKKLKDGVGSYKRGKFSNIAIENHRITKVDKKSYCIIDFNVRKSVGLHGTLADMLLALYLFAVRKNLDGIRDKGIEAIIKDAKKMNRGEFPAWFTENTQLPELVL